MSDNQTLVHVEVDGTHEAAKQVREELQKSGMANYEFIVSTGDEIGVQTVIDRDTLVEDIAEEVTSRLR